MKRRLNGKIERIIDANTNRLTEGVRVCEDVARFALNDRLAVSRFKSIRHRASLIINAICGDKKSLVLFRDSEGDIGKASIKTEKSRKGISDIFKANIKRSEESTRVLEEFVKLSNPVLAGRFKKIRFELYSLEKTLIEKL